jgi:FAM72 protein
MDPSNTSNTPTRSPSATSSLLATFTLPHMNLHSRLLPYRPISGVELTRSQGRRAMTAASQLALAAASGYPNATPPAAQNPSIHPQFRSKTVCRLFCTHCDSALCERGMRAILLGNINVELFSTDIPPQGVQLVFNDYLTNNCA